MDEFEKWYFSDYKIKGDSPTTKEWCKMAWQASAKIHTVQERKRVVEECNEEIEWAQANIDEMELEGNPHNYADDDKIWLPCWLRAHKKILELVAQEDK